MTARQGIFERACEAFRSFKKDERGFVLIFSAFLIPVLLFGTGLVVDVSSMLQERSKAQYAAHFAAVAGAEVLGTQGGTFAQAQSAALAIAARNGYATGVSANRPGAFSPSYGNYTDASANPYALEVRINTQRNNAFGAIFNNLVTPIPVRAVANYGPAIPCIVVLNTGSGVSSGVNLNGVNAAIVAPCGLYINSSDASRALNANTGANKVCASATDPNVMGVVSMNGGSTGQYRTGVCPGMKIMSNQGIVANPYANLTTVPPTSVSSTSTLAANSASSINSSTRPSFTYQIGNAAAQNGCIDSNNGKNSGKFLTAGSGSNCGPVIDCPGNSSCTITYTVTGGYFPDGINITPGSNRATLSVNFSGNTRIADNEDLNIVADSVNFGSGNYYIGEGDFTVNGASRVTLGSGNYSIPDGNVSITSNNVSMSPNQLYVSGNAEIGPSTNNLSTSSATVGGGRYYIGGNFRLRGFGSASLSGSSYYVGGNAFAPEANPTTFGSATYVFAGGLSFASMTATLGSGDYYLGGSGLTLTSSTVSSSTFPNGANGVTIALTNASTGTINIGASSTLSLNAPTTSATNSPRYAGFAVVQSPPASTGSPVNGGASTSNSLWFVNGIAVLPNTNLQFSGGNSSSSCSGFVVWTLTISGNSSITNGCQNTGGNTTALKSAIPAE